MATVVIDRTAATDESWNSGVFIFDNRMTASSENTSRATVDDVSSPHARVLTFYDVFKLEGDETRISSCGCFYNGVFQLKSSGPQSFAFTGFSDVLLNLMNSNCVFNWCNMMIYSVSACTCPPFRRVQCWLTLSPAAEEVLHCGKRVVCVGACQTSSSQHVTLNEFLTVCGSSCVCSASHERLCWIFVFLYFLLCVTSCRNVF